MFEAMKQFQPELFRSYLRVLARVALRCTGKALLQAVVEKEGARLGG